MKISEAIKKAITKNDHRLAGRICDCLRFNYGKNYFEVRDLFVKYGGTAEQFEDLMNESDNDEAKNEKSL